MTTIEIPEAQFYQLFPDVQEKLRVYGGALAQSWCGVLTFTVSDDRVAEILAAVRGEEKRNDG